MRHCRVDVVPSPVICTAYEPDPIVTQKHDVALAIATKDYLFVACTIPPLLLGDFCFAQGASLAASRQSTMFRQRSAASLGDGESLSGPSLSGYGRVFAFHDIASTPELVQLAVLTTAGRNGEHQKCSTVPLDALQHRKKGRSELQITHEDSNQVFLRSGLNLCIVKPRSQFLQIGFLQSFIVLHLVKTKHDFCILFAF
jgi:hypothetical protein